MSDTRDLGREPAPGGGAEPAPATGVAPAAPPVAGAEAGRRPPRRRTGAAFAVALAADAIQWVAFPLFAGGALSPLNDALDVAVAVILVRLLGWHWAFLPTFAAELIPGVDLVPTWTLAAWIATRGKRA